MLALFLYAAAFAVAAAGADRGILVLGDSLSAGYGIDLDQGWVALLEARLAASGYSAEVVNASVSGETTAGALSRLPGLLQRHWPTVVIIELGGNDGLRALPLRAMEDNLRTMVRLSREAGARVLLLGMKIPPNYGPAYAEQFAGVYEDVAQSMDVVFVPFFLQGVALEPGLMQPDGIHPAAAAQPRLLDNVWPALEPLLSSRSRTRG